MYKPQKRLAGQGALRAHRIFQIMTCIYDHDDHDPDGGWMGTGQIARCVGLTTSPNFRGILDEMLAKGWLEVREKAWRRNMSAYEWRLTEAAFHGAYEGSWKAYWTPDEALEP